jgi:hypothetical protein
MIVPASPQRFDGIRDFACRLAAALAPAQDVTIVTTADDAAPVPGATVLPGWGGLRNAAARPGVIYVNYQPQAWLRRDTFALLKTLRAFHAEGARVIVIIHEYQIDPAPTVKRMAGRRLLRSLARAFARRADVIVTTHGFVADLARRDGIDRLCTIATIPVGSNLPASAAAAASGSRAVMFGQPAGMSPSMMGAAARALGASKMELVWCCRDAREANAWLAAHGLQSHGIRVAAGLDPAAVSGELAASCMAVAPIDDGVSTRRTSVAAFLQHGLPIAGTDGRTTDSLLRDSGAFELARIGDAAAMEEAVARVAGDRAKRSAMSAAARALFDAQLSWPRIASRYLELGS